MNEIKNRILLAEDDENLGSLLQEYLQAKNYEADWVTNGEKAFRHFEQFLYDLCLLDVMMPVKDGFTLASEIRILNIPAIGLDTLHIVCAQVFIHSFGHDPQGGQGVHPDAVKVDATPRPPCGQKDFPSSQEIVGALGWCEQEMDILPGGVLRDEEVPKSGVVGEVIIHGGALDDGPENGMGSHLFDLLSETIDDPSVVQAIQVLFNRPDHNLLPHGRHYLKVFSRPPLRHNLFVLGGKYNEGSVFSQWV